MSMNGKGLSGLMEELLSLSKVSDKFWFSNIESIHSELGSLSKKLDEETKSVSNSKNNKRKSENKKSEPKAEKHNLNEVNSVISSFLTSLNKEYKPFSYKEEKDEPLYKLNVKVEKNDKDSDVSFKFKDYKNNKEINENFKTSEIDEYKKDENLSSFITSIFNSFKNGKEVVKTKEKSANIKTSQLVDEEKERKYELLLNDFIYPYGEEDGPKLYRIKALRNIADDVKKGDLGGYIESVNNLSNDDESWVYDNACVSGDSLIKDFAKVKDNAFVFGSSIIKDRAVVKDYVSIGGYVTVGGNVIVKRDTILTHMTYFVGNSIITDNKDILYFGNDYNNLGSLISYVPESDTWTYVVDGSPRAFSSDEFYIYIRQRGGDEIKNYYLFDVIKAGESLRNAISQSSNEGRRDKKYIVPEGTYLSVGYLGEKKISVEELYKQSNGTKVVNIQTVNKYMFQFNGEVVVSEEKSKPTELYKLVILNNNNGAVETMAVKSGTKVSFEGDKGVCRTIDEVFKNFPQGGIKLNGVKLGNNLTLIHIIKFDSYTTKMYAINVNEYDRPIFKLDNGIEFAL